MTRTNERRANERSNDWAEEAFRLKNLNVELLNALESVKGQFDPLAHRYGCECGGFNPPNDPCFRTRNKVLAAIKAATEE